MRRHDEQDAGGNGTTYVRCDACERPTIHYLVPVAEVYNGRIVLSGIDVCCTGCGRESHYVDVSVVKH